MARIDKENIARPQGLEHDQIDVLQRRVQQIEPGEAVKQCTGSRVDGRQAAGKSAVPDGPRHEPGRMAGADLDDAGGRGTADRHIGGKGVEAGKPILIPPRLRRGVGADAKQVFAEILGTREQFCHSRCRLREQRCRRRGRRGRAGHGERIMPSRATTVPGRTFAASAPIASIMSSS